MWSGFGQAGPVKSEQRSENGQDLSALDRGSHQLQWNEPICESENKNIHFSAELKKCNVKYCKVQSKMQFKHQITFFRQNENIHTPV